MTHLDEQGRPEPPLAADETATLLGFLEYQRATLAWKCAGLDAAGLRATVAASSMTLGGMLKHLAHVEDVWCSRWLHGRDRQPPWDTVDWEADPDWDWRSAAEDTPEQLQTLWPTAARSGWPGAPGPTVGHPACDGSWSTWSRSTRGTTAMPTCSGSRWTGSPGSSRRADSPLPGPGSGCRPSDRHERDQQAVPGGRPGDPPALTARQPRGRLRRSAATASPGPRRGRCGRAPAARARRLGRR